MNDCLGTNTVCQALPSPDGLKNSTLWSSFSDDRITAESFRVALSEATCQLNKEL